MATNTQKALTELWDIYEHEKGGRVSDNVDYLQGKFEFSALEKKALGGA